MVETLKWRPPAEANGKRHDNPHHAGQRSHFLRGEAANQSLIEAGEELSETMGSQVLAKIKQLRGKQ